MRHKENHQTLTITEIYKSIQGESSYTGYPCTFIRLTGCPLRCRWCDTVYGFHGGTEMSIAEVIDQVKQLNVNLVELTGGEPLAQANAIPLMEALVSHGFKIPIETGGSEPIKAVPSEVHIIMDLKCPASGMSARNLWANLDDLKPSDEIKFVIADRNDFDWAIHAIKEFRLDTRFHCLFSPAFGLVTPKQLVEWMLEVGVRARLNLQTHKYIWSPRAKGV